jgi:GrpB-like predicted nucleotidyltransferase (UPF0157 family)
LESFEQKLARVLSEPIEFVDYDPIWPSVFESESKRLARFFPTGLICCIDHIGSTAVPGLAAKPIIDILVGVDDFSLVIERVAPAMEAAGYDYFFRPKLGDEGPRYPWFIGRDQTGRRVSHIHIALTRDASPWDRLVFRDYLRAHADMADQYARLKRDLSARYRHDREAYTLAKTAFITQVLDMARSESRR